MARKSKTDKPEAIPVSSQALAPLASNPGVFSFLAGWQCQEAFFLLHLAKGSYIPKESESEWDRCQASLKMIAGMIWDWHRQHRIWIPKEVFTRVEFLFRQCGSDGYQRSAESRQERRSSLLAFRDRPTVFGIFKKLVRRAPTFLPEVLSPDKKSKGEFGVMSRLLQGTAADLCRMTGDRALLKLGARMSGLLRCCFRAACSTALPNCLRELRNRQLLPEGRITRLEDTLKAETRRPDTGPPDQEMVSDTFLGIPELMCNHAHVTAFERYRDFEWAHFRECLAPESSISARGNYRKAAGGVDNRLARRDESVQVAEDNVAAKEPVDHGGVSSQEPVLPAKTPHKDRPAGPAVQLGPPGEPCIVLGRKKKPLTEAQYTLIEALIREGVRGLTKDAMEAIRPSARRILKTLRTDADWAKVILMAGQTNGRYRIKM